MTRVGVHNYNTRLMEFKVEMVSKITSKQKLKLKMFKKFDSMDLPNHIRYERNWKWISSALTRSPISGWFR